MGSHCEVLDRGVTRSDFCFNCFMRALHWEWSIEEQRHNGGDRLRSYSKNTVRNSHYLNQEKRNDSYKWLVSGYILKGEKTQLANRLDVGCERKKGVKDGSKVSIPRRKIRIAINWDMEDRRRNRCSWGEWGNQRLSFWRLKLRYNWHPTFISFRCTA